MKLFRSSLLIMGTLAAFAWFLFKSISFLALFPLIPLGIGAYFLNRFEGKILLWFNGLFALFSALIICFVV